MKITAKQAAAMGLSAPVKQVREPSVSRLIVKMRDADAVDAMSSGHAQATAARAGVGIKALRTAGGATLMTLGTPVRLSEAKAIVERLASDPMVEYVEPDLVLKPFLAPNDQDFTPRQWNLLAPTATYSGALAVTPAVPPRTAPAAGAINMPTAWDVTTGSSSVVVAVIDTGITNHPDLNGGNPALPYAPGNQQRFLPGFDFVSLDTIQGGAPTAFRDNEADAGPDDDPTDPGDASSDQEKIDFDECDDGNPANQNTDHGTMTAGIIAANSNNTAGMAGVAWTVKVLPVRAIGKCGGALQDMANAIRWAAGLPVTIPGVTVPNNPAANVAKIIYIGAGTFPGTACGPTLQGAIDAAINAGSVVVAPTGNHGEFNLSSPANCNGVIAVTAHAINGDSTTYANVGPDSGAGPNPTISAPGGGTPTTLGVTPGADGIDDPAWDGFYIWSTAPGLTPPGNIKRTGTSLAAAQVAGVAALIRSKGLAQTPPRDFTPAQIRGALTTSARPHPDLTYCGSGRNRPTQCGIGLLDATRALQAAGPPVVVTAPVSVTVVSGATASFVVEAIGVESYQWTLAGAAIAGATGPSYTTPAITATSNYAVVMTNSFGSTTSAATATVNAAGSNSPSGGGALPLWQLLLLSALLLASRVRIGQRKD